MQFTRTSGFRVAAVAALLIALYAVAGFVAAPKLLRSELLKQIPQTVGVTPAIGEIHFNPFLFQLEIKNFALAAPDENTLIGFERLFVDFQLSSIWHRAYSFRTIEIDNPSVNAVVAPDGTLNLLNLRPKSTVPQRPQDSNAPLPAVRIGSFKVSQGLLAYEDHSRPSEFAARLEPINFELQDFTTGADGGRFTFSGTSKLGERIGWRGHVSVQPVESDGEFQIDALQARTIWEYLEDRLNFVVNSGTVDLKANYRFSLQDAVDLKADISKIAVQDLTVRPKDSEVDWITVPALDLSGTSLDLLQRQAHVDSLTLSGVKLLTWLAPDGSFNLLKLAANPPASASASAVSPAATPAAPPAPAAATPPTPAAAMPAAPPAAATPWKFELAKFALNDASIFAEDRSAQPAAKVSLAPLSLQIEGASLELDKPIRISLDTRVNDAGSLSVSGTVTPQPASADLAVKIAGIDLTAVQPYVAEHTSMMLLGGLLSGDAKLKYQANQPNLRLSGNISVADLHTVDNALHDDFVNWARLELKGVNYQHAPDRLEIEQINVSKPYARVIIEPDTSLNVSRVLAGPGATLIEPPAPGGASVTMATAPAQAPAGPGGKTAHGAARGKAAPGTIAASAPPPMPIDIKKIALRGGQANFADLSVAPNFSTGIQNLEGTVLGLSSKPGSRAKVDIHGAVDAFSPVAISGDVNVLSAALYTDLGMSFRNMELSTFNPYSDKFAGYNISKGKLTTELHYKVVGRKLDAQHHITVDQLEFGEKTASKEAVSLPIKLAVALLKDRNGVIDLDIPVSGTLDDPQFRLGPIIWKVFVNILEKAVTAPFALLGALFGGGPDLQFIDFQPGDAGLTGPAEDKLRAVVKAMNERPQLKIEVPIATVPELDRPALIEAQFQAALRDALANRAGPKKAATGPLSFDQLDPAAQLELLTQIYHQKLGAEPQFPEAIGRLKPKPALIAAKVDFLTRELHAHLAITDADLEALGQQRAATLQQALLGSDTQIDPARVFLVANDKATPGDAKVRLELSLQ